MIGEITAIMASVCWTLSSNICEKNGSIYSAVAMNFTRQIASFIILGIILFFMGANSIGDDINIKGVVFLALSGLIGFSLGDSFLMSAFTKIGAKTTLLIFSLSPVLAAIMGRLIFNEKLGLMKIAGMAIVLIGIMIVIYKGGNKNSDNEKIKFDSKGLIFAFLASGGQAFGVIFSKMGMLEISPIMATEFRLAGAIVGIIVLSFVFKAWDDIGKIFTTSNGRFVLFGNAVIGTCLGVVLSMFAIKYTQAAVAATLMSLSPILILPLLRFYYKEKIYKVEIFGAILSVVGVALLV